jgi:hypothetical protein
MSDDIDAAELARLVELEAKATPGPWTVRFSINVECADGFSPMGVQSTHFDGTARAEANAEFIAAARNALPRLLALLAARPTTESHEAQEAATVERVAVAIRTAFFEYRSLDDDGATIDWVDVARAAIAALGGRP